MIKKIKAVKHDFCVSSGPSKTVTLGFQDTSEGKDYILGIFYIGPHMDEKADHEAAACERTIDRMITADYAYQQSL